MVVSKDKNAPRHAEIDQRIAVDVGDVSPLGTLHKRENSVHIDLLVRQVRKVFLLEEVVVENNVCLIKGFHRGDGQQVGIARAESHQGYTPLPPQQVVAYEQLFQVGAPPQGGDGQKTLQRRNTRGREVPFYLRPAHRTHPARRKGGAAVAIPLRRASFFLHRRQ